MARVKHRKAMKDYPQAGIKKGEMYYIAKIKTGPRSSRTIRQKEPIKPSQLTSSEYKITLRELEERSITGKEDISDLARALEDLAQETRDKFDNMPEGLQQGDTGQLLEQRADACDEAVQEIDSIADNLPDEDSFDPEDSDHETYEEALQAAAEEAMEIVGNCDV